MGRSRRRESRIEIHLDITLGIEVHVAGPRARVETAVVRIVDAALQRRIPDVCVMPRKS